MEKKTMKTTILKRALKLLAVFSLFSTTAYAERDIASLSVSQASQKIEDLKRSLETTKGDKRGKIVKKIAELENKVLEKTLRAAGQRQR
jgi:hypothetical protein